MLVWFKNKELSNPQISLLVPTLKFWKSNPILVSRWPKKAFSPNWAARIPRSKRVSKKSSNQLLSSPRSNQEKSLKNKLACSPLKIYRSKFLNGISSKARNIFQMTSIAEAINLVESTAHKFLSLILLTSCLILKTSTIIKGSSMTTWKKSFPTLASWMSQEAPRFKCAKFLWNWLWSSMTSSSLPPSSWSTQVKMGSVMTHIAPNKYFQKFIKSWHQKELRISKNKIMTFSMLTASTSSARLGRKQMSLNTPSATLVEIKWWNNWSQPNGSRITSHSRTPKRN